VTAGKQLRMTDVITPDHYSLLITHFLMTLSGWEAVFFWVFITAIFAGLLTVIPQTIHSALF
jgi:hypothetical protein